jgi:hypothetical protein
LFGEKFKSKQMRQSGEDGRGRQGEKGGSQAGGHALDIAQMFGFDKWVNPGEFWVTASLTPHRPEVTNIPSMVCPKSLDLESDYFI